MNPPDQPDVDLSSWQDPTRLRWSFQHIDELMPTVAISADGPPVPMPRSSRELDLRMPCGRLGAGTDSIEAVLDDTDTDGFIVVHDGELIHDQYRGDFTSTTRHLVMSVSKSILGAAAGVLADRGILDVDAPVRQYVPEVAETGYRGATVRDVLDMRTGIAFSEAYTDPDSEVRVMERSAGWATQLPGDPAGLYDYITTLDADGPHGGRFTYRSVDTNLLGWICERASGRTAPELISKLIWTPMGAVDDAFVTVDPTGTAVHDGGICATLPDLARFGMLLCNGGVAAGRQVVPRAWLDDAFSPAAGVREAFAGTDNEPVLPGGWYRDQFWFVRRGDAPVLLCLGIHGQLIYVHPRARTVVVKLSSWPDAQDSVALIDTLRACGSIADALPAADR